MKYFVNNELNAYEVEIKRKHIFNVNLCININMLCF